MPTTTRLEGFYQFASSQIAGGGAELSMDELYCLWRAKNPAQAEIAESVAALRAAHAEMEAGEGGRPARASLRETCERLGLVIDE